MKFFYTLLSLPLFVLFACGEQRAATDNGSGMDSITYACYRYVSDRDTVTLQLQRVDELATGALSYSLFEKDKNQGTVQGTWFGDTLFADYLFTSEGMVSMREVAFVKRGNSLVEGYGELVEHDGRIVIKDRKAIIFRNTVILDKVPCTYTAAE